MKNLVTSTEIVPTLHASGVAWMVGSMVAILVTVGLMAATFGAIAHHRDAARERAKADPPPS